MTLALWIQVNAGDWQVARGTTAWEHHATLLPGPNTVAAYAVDGAGNRSPTDTVRFVSLHNLVLAYWPMHSGDWKTYTGPIGEATVRISGGPKAFTMELDSPEDNAISYYEYGTENKEVLLTGGKYGWTRFSFAPPIVELDSNLILKGGSRTTSFRIEVRGQSFAATAKVTVSPAGTITVPVGTFTDCRRVDIAITATIPGEGTGAFAQEAYTLAPRAGMIRVGAYEGTGNSFRFLGWQNLTAGQVGGGRCPSTCPPAGSGSRRIRTWRRGRAVVQHRATSPGSRGRLAATLRLRRARPARRLGTFLGRGHVGGLRILDGPGGRNGRH
jgi:hypothetical protein